MYVGSQMHVLLLLIHIFVYRVSTMGYLFQLDYNKINSRYVHHGKKWHSGNDLKSTMETVTFEM